MGSLRCISVAPVLRITKISSELGRWAQGSTVSWGSGVWWWVIEPCGLASWGSLFVWDAGFCCATAGLSWFGLLGMVAGGRCHKFQRIKIKMKARAAANGLARRCETGILNIFNIADTIQRKHRRKDN